MRSRSKKYYVLLDILRIISCILVLLYHLNILKGGFLAVCTFFALSGYLGCLSALNNKKFSIKEYYVSRFKKIYIPLIIVVFITVILVKITNITWLNLKQETTSVIFGYNNFWQLSVKLDYFARAGNSPFIHLWYISILMQFDLIFPILFVLFKKIDKKVKKNLSIILVFLLTVLSTGYFYYLSQNANIMAVYYNTFARIFSILIGVFVALVHYKYYIKQSKILNSNNKLIFTLYIIFLIIMCIFINSESKYYALYMILTTIISVRLIKYATVKNSRTNNRVLNFISKSTYEIYLVQYPVIFFMKNIIVNEYLKVIIIIIFTLIISFILHFILSKSRYIIFKIIKFILFLIVIIFGSFLVITEKDHTREMKELEQVLNNNSKNIKQKNSEYINNLKKEQEEWDKLLQSMDDEESKIAEIVSNLPVMGIGDSVMLGAINGLYKKFPNGYFDGEVSRSTVAGEKVLLNLKNSGKLGNILILGLATNTTYSDRRIDNIMNIVDDRQVYWINCVGCDDGSFNSRFAEYSKKYPNIHIVKWDDVAKGHPEYLYKDGIHPKGDGINAYVDAIYNTLYDVYKEEYKVKREQLIKEHEEEEKNKITFYGNDLLTNSYSYIQKKFTKATFNIEDNFNDIYDKLNTMVKDKSLEHRIVLLFDNNISIDQYKKIIKLCKDYEIYIVNINNEKLKFNNDNVKVINFYNEINKNEDYILADKIHLTEKGSKALTNKLYKKIEGDN